MGVVPTAAGAAGVVSRVALGEGGTQAERARAV